MGENKIDYDGVFQLGRWTVATAETTTLKLKTKRKHMYLRHISNETVGVKSAD